MRKNYIKEIIETFLGNEMPQEVQQAFGDWLRDPEARTEKEQTLETYWERLEAAERPGRDRKLARLHEAIRREESFRRRSLWRKVAAAAAVVLLAVGVNYFAAQGYLRSRVQTNIVTSAHDKGEYVLPDGTRIWLNAGSVLRYYGDLSGRKRVVALTGEAFFKGRRDEKRPFILKADDMNIEVLGTEFDFINYAEFSTTEVILCSGSVRAFGGRLPRPVILKPGERLAYSKKDGRISLSQVTALNYSQWMNGELSFDNAPLSDIIANLQRWYAVEIDCPEEWARQVRMSFAVIRNESIDEILKAMSLVVDINYARENRHVTIIPRESRNHK